MTAPPSGARFHRCALQVDPGADVEALIAAASRLGVGVLGLAAVHAVDRVEAVVDAARPRGITVFPGFRATSSQGVDVVCLFEVGTPRDKLDQALGRLGYDESTGQCALDTVALVARVAELRGLGIVQATGDGGLLTRLSGAARDRAWRAEVLTAAVGTGVEDLPEGGPAVVGARRVTAPDDLDDPAARCRLKMSTPSLEGLRQAFLDPESRVRPDDGELAPTWPRIGSIRWSGGFLDGGAIAPNDNLSVLIGGRGTGKSAVLESLRYALDLDVHPDLRKAHADFVKDVLRAGTSITVELETGGAPGARYTVERVVPDPPRVRDAGGAVVVGVRPRDLFQAELLGQGELARLADDRVRRTALLDRFLEPDPGLLPRKAELRRKLERSRQQVLEISRELEADRDAVSKLVGLREKLKRFEGQHLEERLKERTLLGRERQLLDDAVARVRGFDEPMEALGALLPVDTGFLADPVLAELPGRAAMERARAALSALSDRVGAARDELRAALSQAEAELAAARGDWAPRELAVESTYKALLREMAAEGLRYGNDFVTLKEQLAALEPREARLAAQEDRLAKALQARADLLAEWDVLLQQEHQRRGTAAKKIKARLDRVRVNVRYRGDLTALWKLLKGAADRLSTDRLEDLPPETMSPHALADAIRRGADALTGPPFGLTRLQAEKLVAAGPELPMQIEELELPTTTEIEFDTGPDGAPRWQPIEQLSKGQKASAVLLILLLAGPNEATPLVVDQPEDDLDNRFVSETIVPALKRAKQERQFLFSTHNANLLVLGDAELIVALETEVRGSEVGARLDPERMGSLDVEPVRRCVEEILEGGRTAFELRRAKYHF